jgi:hypothetical protein
MPIRMWFFPAMLLSFVSFATAILSMMVTARHAELLLVLILKSQGFSAPVVRFCDIDGMALNSDSLVDPSYTILLPESFLSVVNEWCDISSNESPIPL